MLASSPGEFVGLDVSFDGVLCLVELDDGEALVLPEFAEIAVNNCVTTVTVEGSAAAE